VEKVAVSESPTGWYQDDDDPSLARWWDGEQWTEHTMVLPGSAPAFLDEPEDGDVEDLPYFPAAGRTRFPLPGEEPAQDGPPTMALPPLLLGLHDLDADAEDNPFLPGAPMPAGLYRDDRLDAELASDARREDGNAVARRFRAWPLWGRIVVPGLAVAVLVALGVGAIRSMGDDGDTKTTDTTVSSSTTQVTFIPLGGPTATVDGSTTTVPLPLPTLSPGTTILVPVPTTRAPTATTTTPTTAATTTTAAPTTSSTDPTTTTSTTIAVPNCVPGDVCD
jgi:hypothetical protein